MNVAKFFTGHLALAKKADEALVTAKALKAPTTSAEDADIQAFIIKSRKDSKAGLEYYEPVTGAFNGLHKRIVALRKKGTEPLEEAATIAQRLHNAWDSEQRRLAEAERRRQQAEIDRQAEADRQRELAELEEQAIKLEDTLEELSDRERRFVKRMHETQNLAVSVADAGYKPAPTKPGEMPSSGYNEIGMRLMARPKIKLAIEQLREAGIVREQAAAVRTAPAASAYRVEVKPDVAKLGSSRTTKRGIVDPEGGELQLIMAVIGGKHGIPPDVLMVNQARLNDYARDLGDVINRWPGVRFDSDTKLR
jgi:hypothetical protein